MEIYDKDGCYCLLIAILTGAGASGARLIYEHGPAYPACQQFVKQQELSTKQQAANKKEQRKSMKELREKGCGIEMLAAIFDCDNTTVKRNLKKAEDETHDVI